MRKIASNLSELIGNTPMLRLDRVKGNLQATLIGKLEAFNPGSSVKDRIGLAMIEAAEKNGELTPHSTIIEATSGNTGIALAWVAVVKGYKLILTMPESMSIERRKLLISLGAELVLTPAQDGMEGAVKKAEILYQQIPGAFIPRQFDNQANPEIHYRTTGKEIWEDTEGNVDIFVVGVGTGGTISGAGKYLKEKKPDLQVVAVEPEESAVLSGNSPGPHMIQGIGAGFMPSNYEKNVVDEIISVSSQKAIEIAKLITRKEGLVSGISCGANLYAAMKLAEREENKGKNIIVILPDTGERYISTLLFYED